LKVTIEFNLKDEDSSDEYKYEIFKISQDMYNSLISIKDHIRKIEKGYVTNTCQELEDKILEHLLTSGIYSIE